MTCKLKLKNKGLYSKIGGGGAGTCAEISPEACFSVIPKSGSRSSSACNALNFFSRILRSEALVYNSYFFHNSRSTEIIRHYILIQTL